MSRLNRLCFLATSTSTTQSSLLFNKANTDLFSFKICAYFLFKSTRFAINPCVFIVSFISFNLAMLFCILSPIAMISLQLVSFINRVYLSNKLLLEMICSYVEIE